ncbi:MAG: hypothetical protein K6F78_09575 [Bacteroidaceae bacterium]|nr:hypothetical protein [Bacteroidaceae bacterium]
MKKLIYGLASLLLAAVGCTNNDFSDQGAIVPDGQKRTISSITASMDNAETRVFLDGKQVKWEDGDAIYAFSDEENTGWHEYELSSLNPSTGVAEFSGDALTGSEFYAFYPEPVDVDFTSQIVTVPWDYEAIYSQVNYDRHIPMFAKGSDSMMQFKQLGGLLHFRLCGSENTRLEYVELEGNNGELFYTSYDLNYAADDIELVPNTQWSVSSIGTIIEPHDDGMYQYLSETEPFDIWFSLPAGMTFEEGFTLKVGAYVLNSETQEETFMVFPIVSDKAFTVTRAQMANFPVVSTTGVIEPEYGWKTNFCNLSGPNVAVNYYYNYNKTQIFWDLAFLTDEEGDPIYLSFATDYIGGDPNLSWLDGVAIAGGGLGELDTKFHDFTNGFIYRLEDSDGFSINKDADGVWHLRLVNATLYENNGAAPTLTNINLSFDGYLTPPPTWYFTGAAWMSGAYNNCETYVMDNEVFYSMRFLSFQWGDGSVIPGSFQEVMIQFGYVFEGDTPSFPTKAEITDFHLDIMSQGYYWGGVYQKVDDDAVLKIYKNEDGAYEIAVNNVKMYRATSSDNWAPNIYADPIISSFSFVGDLVIND